MLRLPRAARSLMSAFSVAFAAPSFQRAMVLFFGAILSPRRRAATGILPAGTPNNILFRRFAADGTPLSGDTAANLAPGPDHGWPNVSVDRASGAFWVKNRETDNVFDSGHLRQYDAAGNPQGDPIDPGGSSAHVAWQPGGKFILAQDNPDVSGGGVFVRRFVPAAPLATTMTTFISLFSGNLIAEESGVEQTSTDPSSVLS